MKRETRVQRPDRTFGATFREGNIWGARIQEKDRGFVTVGVWFCTYWFSPCHS